MSERNRNDGIFLKITNGIKSKAVGVRDGFRGFMALDRSERRRRMGAFLLGNAMYIIIAVAVIAIAIAEPRFLSLPSIINIISLTAARLPIAIGIGGAIVLSGTDISAGRIVGLTA